MIPNDDDNHLKTNNNNDIYKTKEVKNIGGKQ